MTESFNGIKSYSSNNELPMLVERVEAAAAAAAAAAVFVLMK